MVGIRTMTGLPPLDWSRGPIEAITLPPLPFPQSPPFRGSRLEHVDPIEAYALVTPSSAIAVPSPASTERGPIEAGHFFSLASISFSLPRLD